MINTNKATCTLTPTNPPILSLPGLYLQHKLVWLTEFAGVLSVLFILFDLLCIGGIQQQLFDVGWLQSISDHVHQHLT